MVDRPPEAGPPEEEPFRIQDLADGPLSRHGGDWAEAYRTPAGAEIPEITREPLQLSRPPAEETDWEQFRIREPQQLSRLPVEEPDWERWRIDEIRHIPPPEFTPPPPTFMLIKLSPDVVPPGPGAAEQLHTLMSREEAGGPLGHSTGHETESATEASPDESMGTGQGVTINMPTESGQSPTEDNLGTSTSWTNLRGLGLTASALEGIDPTWRQRIEDAAREIEFRDDTRAMVQRWTAERVHEVLGGTTGTSMSLNVSRGSNDDVGYQLTGPLEPGQARLYDGDARPLGVFDLRTGGEVDAALGAAPPPPEVPATVDIGPERATPIEFSGVPDDEGPDFPEHDEVEINPDPNPPAAPRPDGPEETAEQPAAFAPRPHSLSEFMDAALSDAAAANEGLLHVDTVVENFLGDDPDPMDVARLHSKMTDSEVWADYLEHQGLTRLSEAIRAGAVRLEMRTPAPPPGLGFYEGDEVMPGGRDWRGVSRLTGATEPTREPGIYDARVPHEGDARSIIADFFETTPDRIQSILDGLGVTALDAYEQWGTAAVQGNPTWGGQITEAFERLRDNEQS